MTLTDIKIEIKLDDGYALNETSFILPHFTISAKLIDPNIIRLQDIGGALKTFLAGKAMNSLRMMINNDISEFDRSNIVYIPDFDRLTERFFWNSNYEIFICLEDNENKIIQGYSRVNSSTLKNNKSKYFIYLIDENIQYSDKLSLRDVFDYIRLLNTNEITISERLNYSKYDVISTNIKRNIKDLLFNRLDEKFYLSWEEELNHFLQLEIKNKLQDPGKIYFIDDTAADIIVIGDLHGDLFSLWAIVNAAGILEKLLSGQNCKIIFLGDYLDRGPYQLQLFTFILFLKASFPTNIFMLRGNHEKTIKIIKNHAAQLIPKGYEEPETLNSEKDSIYFVKKYRNYFDLTFFVSLNKYFNLMGDFAYLKNSRILLVHAGIPPFINKDPKGSDLFPYLQNIEDIVKFGKVNLKEDTFEYLEEGILWARPSKQKVVYRSSDSNYYYGEEQFYSFLKKLNINRLIRGHDAFEEGYNLSFSEKLLTIHSTGSINNPSTFYASEVKTPVYLRIYNNCVFINRVFLQNGNYLFQLIKNLGV